MIARARANTPENCKKPHDVFRRGDGHDNPYSAGMIGKYNLANGSDLTLTELEAAYNKTAHGIVPARVAVIRANLDRLFEFVLDNATLPEAPTLRGGMGAHERIVQMLDQMRARIEKNTKNENPGASPYSVEQVRDAEKDSIEARIVRNLLGPNALGCAERIHEQLSQLRGGDEARRSPAFFERVWAAYSQEISALHQELTDPERAEAVMNAYKNVFNDGKKLPQAVAQKLKGISDPRVWVQTLYRELGLFIFINLIKHDDGADGREATSGEVTTLLDIENNDPREDAPSVGRSLSRPIGVNLRLSEQLKLPERARSVFGEPHVILGKSGIVAAIQQATLTKSTLYNDTSVTLAAHQLLGERGAKKRSSMMAPYAITSARRKGFRSPASSSRSFPDSRRGVLLVPQPRTLV